MSTENADEDEFECPLCGDVFESEDERDEHLAQIHPD